MNKQIASIRKEELEKLKTKLFEKIFRDLSNKYRRLIYEKQLDIKTCYPHLAKEIEKTFDFSNPDYPKMFQVIEKKFLKEISSRTDQIRNQMLSEEKVANALVDPLDDCPKRKAKDQQDEWTLINKYNYLTYQEEEKKKKEEDKLNKKKFQEDLRKQIELKEKIKREEKEKENRMNELEISYNLKGAAPIRVVKDPCSSLLVEENKKLAELKRKIKEEEKHQDEVQAHLLGEKIKEEEKKEEVSNQSILRKKEELKEYLRKQMEQKEKQKESVKNEREILQEKVNIIMLTKEKEKIKKISIQNYKDELDKQMRYRERCSCGMSDVEKRMNKDLIEKSTRYLASKQN